MKLILASSSPRRLQMLNNMGFKPDAVIPADIDETPFKNEKPDLYSARMAKEKAEKIAASNEGKGAFVLGADSIACVGMRILGKPEDANDAFKMVRLLCGRKHRVYSSIALVTPEGKTKVKTVLTYVKMKNATDEEIRQYVATNNWVGRSGSYGLQEDMGGFVITINGSYSNVIGLPMYETKNMLLGNGYRK